MSSLYQRFILECSLFGLVVACSPQQVIGQAQQPPQNSQSSILYGDHFAYTIAAPKGWIMDEKTAQSEGLSVVFYRPGENWKTGKATMYVNVIERKKGLKAKDMVAGDIATFKKHHPGIKVTEDKTLHTHDGRAVITYRFGQFNKASTNASDERVAYVEMPTVVLLIALTATTAKDYQGAVADHTALVNSVFWVASKVEIKRAK